MKHTILSILILIFIFPSISSDYFNEKNHSFLYDNYFDPGHKQKRGAQLGKDRSAIELYFGFQPSVALKLNFYGAKHGALTERGYIIAGMDFDSDLYAFPMHLYVFPMYLYAFPWNSLPDSCWAFRVSDEFSA